MKKCGSHTQPLCNSNLVGAKCSFCSTIHCESETQLKPPWALFHLPSQPPFCFCVINFRFRQLGIPARQRRPTSSLFTAFAAAPLMLAGQRRGTSADIVELTALQERRCGSPLPLLCSDRRATALVFSPRIPESEQLLRHQQRPRTAGLVVTTKGRSYREPRSQRGVVSAALQLLRSSPVSSSHSQPHVVSFCGIQICVCVYFRNSLIDLFLLTCFKW